MDFELTETHKLIRETARRLAREVVAPRATEIDLAGEYPEDIFQAFKEVGLIGTAISEEYDGGELVIDDTYGPHEVKLPAGDMVLYPGTSLHRVLPVKRGARYASFFWIQSLVREDAQRTILFDMDMAVVRLRQQIGDNDQVVALTGIYHNLLRRWATV